jgi:signal transduction histidine kinase
MSHSIGAWREFDITVNEQGQAVNHPVRAAVVALDGNRLLVGTDVSERRRFTQRLRATTFWGIGLTAALIAVTGWWFSRRLAARVRAMAEACAASSPATRRAAAGPCAMNQPAVRNGQRHARSHRQQTSAVRDLNSAAHDLRAPLYRMVARLETTCRARSNGAPAGGGDPGRSRAVQRTLATLPQIAQVEAGGGGVPPEQTSRKWLELEIPRSRRANVA